jgi:hypothetical protein
MGHGSMDTWCQAALQRIAAGVPRKAQILDWGQPEACSLRITPNIALLFKEKLEKPPIFYFLKAQ